MLLEELLTIIPTKTGESINQSTLAESLGITRQTVSNRIKNASQLTVSEIFKIEEFFNIKIFSENRAEEENIAYIDYYSNVFASCGAGSIVFSEDKTQIPIATFLIDKFSKQKRYSMINATGNSMAPTIDSGDKLVVEHWTGDQIQDNKIYVFCFNNEFFVKRLSKNLDEIIIKSDNSDYRTRTISGDTISELTLIGKIVGVIKAL